MAAPKIGKVGPGDQNDWKPNGTVYKYPYKNYANSFKKGNITENTTRNDNECWNAGTPVTWEEDDKGRVVKIAPITISLAGIPDMLITRDPKTGDITEYHPVITFFNEVIAQIMRDGHRDWISNLEKEVNAIKMWQYIEKKYLNGGKKTVAKKKRKTKPNNEKMAASKMRKPVKKSKPSKQKLAKKK